jgi:hypothetical protein
LVGLAGIGVGGFGGAGACAVKPVDLRIVL